MSDLTLHYRNSRLIGLDILKRFKTRAREKVKKLDFILADMSFMPFKNHSVDIVVCISVLEHIQDLDDVVREIKNVLKRDGIFVVGYPIETKFFKFVWRFTSPWNFRFIDQSQDYWCNPYTGRQECYWKSPLTHKHNYPIIRYVIGRYFKILQKEKLPFNTFPDSLTYYECAKCTP